MCRVRFPIELPEDARPAVEIVRRLADAGQTALLAGGCVRDLLLGHRPKDYDVATDAPPGRICRLFRRTRRVGAQFGVVLVRKRGRWIEGATFRTDGQYSDGRRPDEVHFSDAAHDAYRRDFTINGMFLDPLAGELIDYVGGQADLRAALIRAIGDPARRFAEDHLRLLRAVRFAARLGFTIETQTLEAIRAHAADLRRVAAERIREELERILRHTNRHRGVALLEETGLLAYLWAGARWSQEQLATAQRVLAALPAACSFELPLAVLLADRSTGEAASMCRALACSNDQRDRLVWLIAHQRDLDDPETPTLAQLKRLMAHAAFGDLRTWAEVRYDDFPDGDQRRAALARRIASIPRAAIQPPPLVSGEDLLAAGVPPGPVYAQVLDALYTAQLDERIRTRDQALALLRQLLREKGETP